MIEQQDIWTWDREGNINLLVDFPDGRKGSYGNFRADALTFNEKKIELIFKFPLPHCPVSEFPEATYCIVEVLQNTYIQSKCGIETYNTPKLIFLNFRDEVVGELVQPQYLAISTNPDAWN